MTTEAGKRLLVLVDGLDQLAGVATSKSLTLGDATRLAIAAIEAEAVATYRRNLAERVRAMIADRGGLCVMPDDYSDDAINICVTHSEIIFGDTRTCEDDPRQLRAVLALLEEKP